MHYQKVILFVFLIVLLFSVSSSYALTKEEAIHILGQEILQPSSNDNYITARMIPTPLTGVTIAPSMGGTPVIDLNSFDHPQWFALIDSFPCAMFGHGVRYVLIDDITGEVTLYSANDWPAIDDVPMGLDTSPGEHLILIFPLLPSPNLISSAPFDDAILGDYGDAPDDEFAYEGVMGQFPTLFATNNSLFGRPGAHTINTGLETLGRQVSVEQDARDPADPDGVPNLIDADNDERMFFSWDPNTTPATAHLIYDITIYDQEDIDRYVNVLFDFDQNGQWRAETAVEWVVENQRIAGFPVGETRTFITPAFSWGIGDDISTLVWTRVVLTQTPIDPDIFGDFGWDGSGAFDSGEIEDFMVYLRECHSGSLTPPPPPGEPYQEDPPEKEDEIEKKCDVPIYSHALVVQGVDNPGQTAVREAADHMENFFKSQGFRSVSRLSGNTATAADIEDWIRNVKTKLWCMDRVFIYFIAHGAPDNPGGKIALRHRNPKYLTGAELVNILNIIDSCDGDHCFTPQVCCDVTVLMESCFSGQWMSQIPGDGRRIMTSSNDRPSWFASDGSGGEFSDRFVECSKNIAADTSGNGFVDPSEAFNCLIPRLNTPRPTTPQFSDLTCDCICDDDDDREPRKRMGDGIFIDPIPGFDVFFSPSVWTKENWIIGNTFDEGISPMLGIWRFDQAKLREAPNDWHWYVEFEWLGTPTRVNIEVENFTEFENIAVEIFYNPDFLEPDDILHLTIDTGNDLYTLSGSDMIPLHTGDWSNYPHNLPHGFETTGATRQNYILNNIFPQVDQLDLPPYTQVTTINDHGHLGGNLFEGDMPLPFVWIDGEMDFLDLPEGAMGGSVHGLTNNGLVVGSHFGPDWRYEHATRWQAGEPLDLGTLGGLNSYGHGINDGGIVVGSSETSDGSQRAFWWSGEAGMNELWIPGDYDRSGAIDLNDFDGIVGHYTDGNWTNHAARWEYGDMIDLGALPGHGGSEAQAINSHGLVVGMSHSADWSEQHGVLWHDGEIVDLGSLGGNSTANDINDAGHIVGHSYTSPGVWPSHAVMWYHGETMIDLNDFVSSDADYTLTNAVAINNEGQVVVVDDNGFIYIYEIDVPEENPFDLNNDGIFDIYDFLVFIEEWSNQNPSSKIDYNDDGKIDIVDLQIFLKNYAEQQ